MTDPFLALLENLTATHRAHEQHYAEAPLADAIDLLHASRTLRALADRWTETEPGAPALGSPYAGVTDLNDPRAIATGGVLFLESGEEPPELARLKGRLAALAEGAEETGAWLAQAMTASWGVAETLLDVPGLEDVIAERHRIIADDARSAAALTQEGLHLRRVLAILDRADLTVAGVRADLAGPRRIPALLFAAAELLDRAVDLTLESTTLVRGNERRWRRVHARVTALAAEREAAPPRGPG